MTRRVMPASLIALAIAVAFPSAQSPDRLPVSGTVVDIVGKPVPNVDVKLLRHTFRPPASEGLEVLAHGRTDADGRFVLGEVGLKAELEFPIETGVLLEFVVSSGSDQQHVDTVEFTTPRTDSIVTSVSAEIHVH
jgi:hypothetical protein